MALEVAGSKPVTRPTITSTHAGLKGHSCSHVGVLRGRGDAEKFCGRGGIGRRAGFRYQWRKSWGFKSLRPHHHLAREVGGYLGVLSIMLGT